MPKRLRFLKVRVIFFFLLLIDGLELWYIIDNLFKNHMDTEGLFDESGDVQTQNEIREMLDTFTGDKELPANNFDAYSMAETLLRWLGSLTESVIPSQLYKQTLEASSTLDNARAVIAKLPEVHFNTFYYIVAFLRELLGHKEKNGLTAEKLALYFSSVFIRVPPTIKERDSHRKKKKTFILHFLIRNKKVL